MANQNVTIKNTMLVFPSPKEQNQDSCNILKLSNLDRKCPALMYLVFFYKKAPHFSGGGSLLRDLKKGLEETLAVWYPAAGRLCLDNESGRFNLDCNNFGALLVEAETKVQITELGDVSQENNFLEKLVFRPSVSPDRLTEMPLVVVQKSPQFTAGDGDEPEWIVLPESGGICYLDLSVHLSKDTQLIYGTINRRFGQMQPL